MQHLGTEDELKQVLGDILASMTPEEQLEYLSVKDLLAHTSVEQRLEGIPLEQRLEGLTPDELARFRLLLERDKKRSTR